MSEPAGLTKASRILFMAAAVVVLVAGLQAASQLILPFLVAIFVAVLSLPLLSALQRLRLPSWLAVVVTVLSVILVLVGIGVLVGGSIQDFTAAAPKYQARLKGLAGSVDQWFQARGVPTREWYSKDLFDPGIAIDFINRMLRAVAAILSNTVLVLLTTVFILLEAAGLPPKLRAALGGSTAALERFAAMKSEIQNYLAIKTLVSIVTGSVIAIWLSLLGVDFPLLWGLIAFLMNYIPTLGSILAAIPPSLLALVQIGPGRAVLVALGFAVVNIILGSLIEPHLMGRKLGLSPLIVFLSLVFWGWVWGPIGMLLSVPLTMIIKIVLENSAELRWLAILLDAGPPQEPVERDA